MRAWRACGLAVGLATATSACGGGRAAAHAVETPDAASATHASEPSARRPEAAPPTVELELRQLSSRHIVVPLSLGDEHSLSFILDTGASTSVISRQTQQQLGFRDEDGVPVRGKGANGELDDVRLFSLARVNVGERAYANLDVAVMDLAHLQDGLEIPIAGILGRNFLQHHDVEVDFARGKLRLHARGSVRAGAVDVSHMSATDYDSLLGGLIRIEVNIDGGERFPAVLDLGAARSVINWNAARALGLTPRSKQLRRTPDALLGADNTPIETRFHTFGALRVGEATIEGPTLYIADLEVFDTLGVSAGPAMIFGLDLLGGRSVVIDYDDERVYISREAS